MLARKCACYRKKEYLWANLFIQEQQPVQMLEVSSTVKCLSKRWKRYPCPILLCFFCLKYNSWMDWLCILLLALCSLMLWHKLSCFSATLFYEVNRQSFRKSWISTSDSCEVCWTYSIDLGTWNYFCWFFCCLSLLSWNYPNIIWYSFKRKFSSMLSGDGVRR